ncbi:MAG: GMC oxidoreductase [Porticoccaceae bacterium]
MFIDTRQLESGSIIETTVCIVGGGVAGIAMALELDKQGIDTCVLESGGFKPGNRTRDLYRGESIGLPYSFADGCRSRYLGGSSNCWGGWNHPLDPWDFEQRDWIPYSGWPFGIDELMPFYLRTHELLRLGPYNYDPAYWEKAIGRPDVRRMPLPGDKVRDLMAQFSTPTPSMPANFGTLFGQELKHSKNIRVFLHANAVNIDTDSSAKIVSRIEVATLTGCKISVVAQRFVLATGGIENPRLLLSANKTQASKIQKEGLGNGNDLVGRFFMEHPRVLSGSVNFTSEWSRNKFYDIKYHDLSPNVSAGGVQVAAKLALSERVLKEERLLNTRVWFSSTFAGEYTPAARALYRCKQAYLERDQPGWKLSDELRTMLMNPLDTLNFAFTRRIKLQSLVREVKLQIICEPNPDPDSRVTLSPTETDELGMPRVQVNWRLGNQVRRTFDRTLQIVADELRRSGAAEVTLDAPIEGGDWPESFEREGTWHHMGTTRMHDSPKEGVVDRNCKVHGISNLYIAGSSVFPTAGANLPTMTIIALALRLSDHIAGQLKKF